MTVAGEISHLVTFGLGRVSNSGDAWNTINGDSGFEFYVVFLQQNSIESGQSYSDGFLCGTALYRRIRYCTPTRFQTFYGNEN